MFCAIAKRIKRSSRRMSMPWNHRTTVNPLLVPNCSIPHPQPETDPLLPSPFLSHDRSTSTSPSSPPHRTRLIKPMPMKPTLSHRKVRRRRPINMLSRPQQRHFLHNMALELARIVRERQLPNLMRRCEARVCAYDEEEQRRRSAVSADDGLHAFTREQSDELGLLAMRGAEDGDDFGRDGVLEVPFVQCRSKRVTPQQIAIRRASFFW